MNDDTGDGSSEFKATLTHHSYSELILWPWGHCTDCQSPDHYQLEYHGQQMADMTQYAIYNRHPFIQLLVTFVIGITEFTAHTATPQK